MEPLIFILDIRPLPLLCLIPENSIKSGWKLAWIEPPSFRLKYPNLSGLRTTLTYLHLNTRAYKIKLRRAKIETYQYLCSLWDRLWIERIYESKIHRTKIRPSINEYRRTTDVRRMRSGEREKRERKNQNYEKFDQDEEDFLIWSARDRMSRVAAGGAPDISFSDWTADTGPSLSLSSETFTAECVILSLNPHGVRDVPWARHKLPHPSLQIFSSSSSSSFSFSFLSR